MRGIQDIGDLAQMGYGMAFWGMRAKSEDSVELVLLGLAGKRLVQPPEDHTLVLVAWRRGGRRVNRREFD